jgi:hypothetical protein
MKSSGNQSFLPWQRRGRWQSGRGSRTASSFSVFRRGWRTYELPMVKKAVIYTPLHPIPTVVLTVLSNNSKKGTHVCPNFTLTAYKLVSIRILDYIWFYLCQIIDANRTLCAHLIQPTLNILWGIKCLLLVPKSSKLELYVWEKISQIFFHSISTTYVIKHFNW